MGKQTLRSWLEKGEFTLALSSSFFGFYAHCGIAAALYKEGFRPSRISGSSAGALIGGALASGVNPESMAEILLRLNKSDFWDPYPGPGLLRGRKMLALLKRHLAPDFSETKIPFEAAVFDLFRWKTCFLAEGPLPEAVAASCAVPFLFHPVRISGRLYLDGGVFHKSGLVPGRKQRTLCIFLQGKGWQSAYELGAATEGLGRNQKILKYKGLPEVNYNRLDQGKAAYRQAFDRTLRALDTPFAGNIIDGGIPEKIISI